MRDRLVFRRLDALHQFFLVRTEMEIVLPAEFYQCLLLLLLLLLH